MHVKHRQQADTILFKTCATALSHYVCITFTISFTSDLCIVQSFYSCQALSVSIHHIVVCVQYQLIVSIHNIVVCVHFPLIVSILHMFMCMLSIHGIFECL